MKTLKLISLNLLVVYPIIYFLMMLGNKLEIKHPLTMEALPTKFTIAW